MALFANNQPPADAGARHSIKAWAILWRKENLIDGRVERLVGGYSDEGKPTSHRRVRPTLLFNSRSKARKFQQKVFGYIHHRPDLRREPHGWLSPQVVRVRVTVEEI